MSDLSIGSHLITPRTAYNHHGIYLGNQQVIHFTSNSQIEIVSLSDFTEGQGYSLQSFHSKFSRQEIVERALSRVGNDNYNVIFNNCEHFCNWCILNEPRSQQVRNFTLSSAVSGLTARGIASSQIATNAITPILPAALVGFGVFKLVQFLTD